MFPLAVAVGGWPCRLTVDRAFSAACRDASVHRPCICPRGWVGVLIIPHSAFIIHPGPDLLRSVSRCTPVTDTVNGLGHSQRRSHFQSAKRLTFMERDAGLSLNLILILPLYLHPSRKPQPSHRHSGRNRCRGGSRCRKVSVYRGGCLLAVTVGRCPGLLRGVSRCTTVTDTVTDDCPGP